MTSVCLHSDVTTNLGDGPFECCSPFVMIVRLSVGAEHFFVLHITHATSPLATQMHSSAHCLRLLHLTGESEVCIVCINVFPIKHACYSVDALTCLTAACRVIE